MTDLTLYSMPSSGNSYKVRLLLALEGRRYRHVPIETNTPELAEAKAAAEASLRTSAATSAGSRPSAAQ